MSRRQRRGLGDANISFLDVICCGFGAIILLLVIVKPTPKAVIEESLVNADGQVRALQERLFEIRGQVSYLQTELNAKQEQLGIDQRRVAILRGEFDQLQSRISSIKNQGDDSATEGLDLQVALQSLSKEMRRLLKGRKSQNEYIAGVPVDSEYIIFIIDTSPSMFNVAWGKMIKEVVNTLALYPKVKGIQVMNDQGQYMFPAFRNTWMTDSAARRQAIVQKLRQWQAFSNSSPVEGITAAIRRHYAADKKISLFVLGDDYTGRSVRRVLRIVNSLNRSNRSGESLVRIHGVGFPVHMQYQLGAQSSVMRYAALMRELSNQNNGTFIGLNDVR